MDDRQKLILYGGTSFSTLKTFNRVVPRLAEMGIQPIMMFVKDPISKKSASTSPEMTEFGFFHSRLMNDTIIPFMDARDILLDGSSKPMKKITYTPRQLCKLYADAGVQAYELEDVNAPEHVDFVKSDPSIIAGISEKCRQVFQQPIIDAHRAVKHLPGEGRGHLMNVHPGRLPHFRGLLPIPRAIIEGKKYIVSTIHAIEKGGVNEIDTGTVYGSAQQDVNFDQSILGHYENTSDAIPSMIAQQVDDILTHGAPTEQIQQEQSEAQYYSWLSKSDLEKLKETGVNLVGAPKDEARALTRAFANGSVHGPHLRAAVDSAVNQEYGRPVSEPTQILRSSSSKVKPPHSGLRPLGAVA